MLSAMHVFSRGSFGATTRGELHVTLLCKLTPRMKHVISGLQSTRNVIFFTQKQMQMSPVRQERGPASVVSVSPPFVLCGLCETSSRQDCGLHPSEYNLTHHSYAQTCGESVAGQK